MSSAGSWRSAADWKDQGLPLTTTNDRACKLYDAALSQYVTWSDDPLFGGLGKTVMDCVDEDPTFVMGKALSVGLELLSTGHSMKLDPSFQEEMDKLQNLASTQPITDREKRHVKALKLYSEGFHNEACDIWEDILLDHPTDILALKLVQDSYFFLGQAEPLRDSVAAVLPRWKSSLPLYSWLHGMHAFGLEETFLFPQAEKAAHKAIELNIKDCWATHALAHVYEMQGRTDEGISFLSTTLQNWQGGNLLANHNFWHWGLYHIEQREPEAALDIFETQLNRGIKKGSMLDIVDSMSMLWRLKMEGVDVSKLWTDGMEACRPHFDDHLLLFNDMHFLMAALGSGDTKATEHLTNSLEKYLSSEGQGANWTVSKEFGSQLFKGMQAMSEERYSDAVSLLHPIIKDLHKMGGSHAQRDLYNIALISSAVKSPNPRDQALARKLLISRKLFKGRCSLAERMNCNYQPYLQV